jgi:hypothetical protein
MNIILMTNDVSGFLAELDYHKLEDMAGKAF